MIRKVELLVHNHNVLWSELSIKGKSACNIKKLNLHCYTSSYYVDIVKYVAGDIYRVLSSLKSALLYSVRTKRTNVASMEKIASK